MGTLYIDIVTALYYTTLNQDYLYRLVIFCIGGIVCVSLLHSLIFNFSVMRIFSRSQNGILGGTCIYIPISYKNTLQCRFMSLVAHRFGHVEFRRFVLILSTVPA